MTLGYCLNVHPGETLDEVCAALEGPVARVRSLSGGALAVGLYLGANAARTVRTSEPALERLRSSIALSGARVFTANAFPFGGFHADEVKRAVYRPTWSQPDRLRYTLDVAEVLATLLAEGEKASISTSPVSYRAFDPPEPALEAAGAALGEAAAELERIARDRGRELALALEPEPLATMERATELVPFLATHVFGGAGRARISRALGVGLHEAETVARRRVGACLDACHHAVAFEPIADALATYEKAGVRVVKAQLSSALELAPREHPAGAARLRTFAEPRYLHQTFWSRSGERGSVEDLPLAFEGDRLSEPFASADLVRSHVHVPLAWEGERELGTTRRLLAEALPALARATTDLEVETYTWSVLPRASFSGDVARGIADELAWVRGQLG